MISDKVNKLKEELKKSYQKIKDFRLKPLMEMKDNEVAYLLGGISGTIEDKLSALEGVLFDLKEKRELLTELLRAFPKSSTALNTRHRELLLSLIKADHKGKITANIKRLASEMSADEILAETKRALNEFACEEKILEAKVKELEEELKIEIQKEEELARAALADRVRRDVEAKGQALAESRRAWKEFKKELEKMELLLNEFRLAEEEAVSEKKISELRHFLQ